MLKGKLKVNTILHDDCMNVLKDLPNSSVDLIIADPPYLTISAKWDKVDVVTPRLVEQFRRVLKDSGSLYVWCGIGEKSQSLIRWFPLFSEVLVFKDFITWKKRRGMGTKRGWLYAREECMWFVKSGNYVWNESAQYNSEPNLFSLGFAGKPTKSKFKRIPNVWTDIPQPLLRIADHDTPKPVKAIARIVKAHTKKGDLVVDPFSGSGTTAVVCKMLGRRFICIEKDEEHWKYSKLRLQATYGGT